MTYDYPIWYILLSILVSVFLSYFMYKKNIKTSWKFIFMAFLRFLSLVILFIALGKLMLFIETKTTKKSKLILAFDLSESMTNIESEENLNSLFSSFNNSEISEKYNYNTWGFGDYVDKIDTLKFNHKRSNFAELENSLDLFLEKKDRVIIVSDGNINDGSINSFSAKKKYNIDVIGVGDTIFQPQINISKINYNSDVVVGNSSFLELFIESRNIKSDFKIDIFNNDIKIYSDILLNTIIDIEHSVRYSFLLKSNNIGANYFDIKVTAVNYEKVIAEKRISINGKKNKGKVLMLFDYPQPDVSLYKRELLKRNYLVNFSKTALSHDSINKYDFIIDFSNQNKKNISIPVIQVSELKNNNSELYNLAKDNNNFLFDNNLLKSIKINEKEKRISIEEKDLWKLNLEYAKRKNNNLEAIFNAIFKKVEFLKFKDHFKIIYKDIYSSSEDVKIKMVNTTSLLIPIKANIKIKINQKNEIIDFVNDAGEYKLNLSNLEEGNYRGNIYVNNTYYKRIHFAVKNIEYELLTQNQNLNLLKNISIFQKGSFFQLKDLEVFRKKILDNIENKHIIITKETNIIENWYFLFLVLIFLGLEWFLRKRNGLY